MLGRLISLRTAITKIGYSASGIIFSHSSKRTVLSRNLSISDSDFRWSDTVSNKAINLLTEHNYTVIDLQGKWITKENNINIKNQ